MKSVPVAQQHCARGPEHCRCGSCAYANSKPTSITLLACYLCYFANNHSTLLRGCCILGTQWNERPLLINLVGGVTWNISGYYVSLHRSMKKQHIFTEYS